MKYKIFVLANLLLIFSGIFILDSTASALSKSGKEYCRGVYTTSNLKEKRRACEKAFESAYKSGKKESANCKAVKRSVRTACRKGATQGEASRSADNTEVKAAVDAGITNNTSKTEICKAFNSNSTLKKYCEKAYDKAKRTADSTPYQKCGDVSTYFNFDCAGANTKTGGKTNPIFSLLITALSWVTGLVVLAVIGGIVYGGVLYTTAQDNSAQTQKAITYVVNSVIALVLWLSAYVFMNFIIPGGLF